MPEIEREEVIAQRLEELQRITDKRNLDQMLKAQKDGDGDSVAKAAKRAFFNTFPRAHLEVLFTGQHTVRGATKEKSRKLDELKAKRKAKDERKRVRASLPRCIALSQSCPSLVALRSATDRRLPWKWKLQMMRQRMVKLPSLSRKKRKNANSWARLTSTMSL